MTLEFGDGDGDGDGDGGQGEEMEMEMVGFQPPVVVAVLPLLNPTPPFCHGHLPSSSSPAMFVA